MKVDIRHIREERKDFQRERERLSVEEREREWVVFLSLVRFHSIVSCVFSLHLFSHWKIVLQDFTSGKIPFPLSPSSPFSLLSTFLDNNLIFERLLREEREEFTTISIRILWMGNYQGRRKKEDWNGKMEGLPANIFCEWNHTFLNVCWFFDEQSWWWCEAKWSSTMTTILFLGLLIQDSFRSRIFMSVLSIFPTTSLLHHLHHSFTTLSFLICFWLIIRKSFKKSLQTHSGEKINNTGKLTSESSLTDSSSFPLYRLSLFQCSFSLCCVRREKFHKKCSKILNLFKKTYTRNNLTQTSNVGYIFKRRKRMIWKFWSFWNQV